MTVLLANKFHYLKGGAERYYLDLGDLLARRGERVVHLSMRHAANLAGGAGRSVRARGRLSRPDGPGRAGRDTRLRSIYNRGGGRGGVREIVRARPARRRAPSQHLPPALPVGDPGPRRGGDSDRPDPARLQADLPGVPPADGGRGLRALPRAGATTRRCGTAACSTRARRASSAPSRPISTAGSGPTRRSALFLCPSRFLLEKVASFGVRAGAAGSPALLPSARALRRRRRSGRNYYVYAGRLSREKGIATLLEAHARLAAGAACLCGSWAMDRCGSRSRPGARNSASTT